MENFFEQSISMWPLWRWAELVAATSGLVSFWYLRSGRVLGYPVGMASTALYIWVNVQATLYAHAVIFIFFFLLRVYGWHHWLYGGIRGRNARYGYCGTAEWRILILGMSVGATGTYAALLLTDSDVALWDALTATGTLASVWLLARKRIESWLVGLVADLATIPLLLLQGMWVTAIQLCVFLWIGVSGFKYWQKLLAHQRHQDTPSSPSSPSSPPSSPSVPEGIA